MAAAICEVLCGKERVTKHILLIIGIMFLTGGLFFSQNVFAAVTGLKSLKYSECMTVVSDDFFFTETVEDRVRHEDKTGDNYAAGELLVFYKQHISHLEAESDAAAYGAELIGYIGSAKICQWYFGDEYSLNELQDKAQKAEKNRNIRSAGLNYIFYDEPCVSGYFYDGEKSGLNGDQEGVMRIQEARKLFMDEVERRGSVFPVNVGIYDTAFYSNHEDLKFEGLFYNFTEDVFNVKIKEPFDKRKSNTFWDKVWPIPHKRHLLRKCNAQKEKGVPVLQIFKYKLCNVFADRSMYMQQKTGAYREEFSKNAFYRFLNNRKTNWLRFTTLLSKAISGTIEPLTSDDRVTAFVVDDSLFERTSCCVAYNKNT